MSLSTIIALRKIDDRIVRAETQARIARADIAKYERWIANNDNGFGQPVNADALRTRIAEATKVAARHDRAAAKARKEAAALV